ncbi:MAG: lysostaphin resistance A-like protein [Bacteroidota bacterium]
MPLQAQTPPAIPWRLRDLAVAGILAFAFLAPLSLLSLPWLSASPWNLVILGVVLEALAVLPAVAITACRRGVRHLWQMGLGRYPWKKGLVLGLAGGAGLFLLVQGCGGLLEALGVRPAPQKFLTEVLARRETPLHLAVFFLVVAVVAPLWEEIFFRGLVYVIFRRAVGIAAGAVLSGFLFALLHAEPMLLRLPICLLGVGLALFYEASGSLYPPMIAHGVSNILSALLALAGLGR